MPGTDRRRRGELTPARSVAASPITWWMPRSSAQTARSARSTPRELAYAYRASVAQARRARAGVVTLGPTARSATSVAARPDASGFWRVPDSRTASQPRQLSAGSIFAEPAG